MQVGYNSSMHKASPKLIVGNWKMNPGSLDEAKKLSSGIKRKLKQIRGAILVLCPPSLFFTDVAGKDAVRVSLGKKKSATKNKKISKLNFGVQNIFTGETGSHTGELSARMAQSIGAGYVIIGHSERRAMGESNEMIAQKVADVLAVELTPIVCIGEKSKESDGFMTELPIQIKTALSKVKPIDVPRIIFAYEPVYAIGAAHPVTGHEVHQRNIFIKKVLTEIIGKERAFKVQILYGGSADPEDTIDLIKNGAVDGLLVGRASLDVNSFTEIAEKAGSI